MAPAHPNRHEPYPGKSSSRAVQNPGARHSERTPNWIILGGNVKSYLARLDILAIEACGVVGYEARAASTWRHVTVGKHP